MLLIGTAKVELLHLAIQTSREPTLSLAACARGPQAPAFPLCVLWCQWVGVVTLTLSGLLIFFLSLSLSRRSPMRSHRRLPLALTLRLG